METTHQNMSTAKAMEAAQAFQQWGSHGTMPASYLKDVLGDPTQSVSSLPSVENAPPASEGDGDGVAPSSPQALDDPKKPDSSIS